MTVISFAQQPEESLASECDVFLASSGYEERASFCSVKYSTRALTKIALAFDEQSDHPVRRKNDRRFRHAGFSLIRASGDASNQINEVLVEPLQRSNRTPRVVVDFSSMTRVWLATIIRALTSYGRPVEALFSYTPSKFSRPRHDDLNPVHVGPILPDDGPLQQPSAPISLVLGIGYGQDEAIGVVELLDPRETFAFFTDTPLDARFARQIARANDELFTRVGRERIIPYSLNDWDSLAFTLDSLCSRLQYESRTVLISLGPKPFSLISLLVAAARPQLGVWRVSTGPQAPPHPRQPLGVCIPARVVFSP